MYPHKLDEYDIEKLEQARELSLEVFEYHYGDSHMRKEANRLETIITKIDYLLNA